MNFLISVTGKIAEYAIGPVGRQFGYLFYYNSNIETLKAKVQKLESDRDTVAALADAATRNGELILPNVQNWQTSVHQICEESRRLLNNQVNENQKCFSRQLPCPDLVSRYRVSRKSSKKSLQVDELLKDVIKFHHKVAAPAPPPPASAMFAEHVEAFESRKSTFEAIMEALKNDQVNMIGIYGMGGIGKTTMVKQVAKEAEKLNLFDEFAMAVVSQNPDVCKIQRDIAEYLRLKLDEKNESVRAGCLFERMNQGKRILLVLDDLWTPITLAEIGIPSGREHAHKCCKIILTSRNLDVCQQMNCDSFIPIGVLSDTDAWNYFRAIAGDAVDSPDLRPIPAEIVAKCAGLPIAIKTIGGALKGKSQHVWKDARSQLRNSTAQNIQGVDKNVYSVLQVSYNFLDSEELRYCFLISCLFEEDADISMEDLVRYGLGLNLFQGVDSVEGARDRAYVLVDNLKARSLLMDGKTGNSAKMHDVIRDFAHFLASSSNDHVFLVRQGAEIIEWPNRDSCNRYTAISLLSQQISELPGGLDCSKLEILIFEHVRNIFPRPILKIPSNFFQGMKQLRVLKMRHCCMTSIPASITLLKDLETLCLEDSSLGDLSQIGGLKKLKVLSLAGSYFKELPRENGLPRNLMVIDLSRCQMPKVVPPNLISSLIKLECLYMLNVYARLQWSWGGRNATVDELKHLPHLNTLEMHLSDISLLPRDLSFQNLIRFRVYLGNHEKRYWDLRRDLGKMLVISLEPDHNNNLPDGVKTLMKRAQALIIEFKGYIIYPADSAEEYFVAEYLVAEYPHPSALSDLDEDGFKNLSYLEVMENFSMKYLVDSSNASRTTRSFFPVLEELRLKMLGLNEICCDDLPYGSFGKLRELKLSYLPNLTKLWSMNDSARYPRLVNLCSVQISDCKELKHVFPYSALALLGELKTLKIMDCESLEGIFLEDRPETGDVIQLPKLQSLTIRSLPSLKSFCCQKNKAHAGQLLGTKILFPALRNLGFSNCKNIVTVFPSNVQHSLQNLAYLEIVGCESLVAILELEDTVTSMLPQWQQSELPREFPSLKTIHIRNCPKIKAFAAAASSMLDLIPPFFDGTVSFPALERLLLYGVDMPKQIWDPRLLPVNSFCSLTEVEFDYCRSLITIFPSNVLPRLQCLREITLASCDLLERVFDAHDAHKVTLPGLQSLYLSDLRADLIRSFFSEKIMFPALQKLYLEDLNDVKGTIFPSSVLRGLKNLETISIGNCELVEEVFGFDNDDAATVTCGGGTGTFPFLKVMYIWNCPKMKTFMAAHAHEHNLSGDYIKHFFHEKIMFPALQKLYLEDLNDVKGTIFPSSVLRGLKNLETISIGNCELVEEVFGFDNDDAATITCGGGTGTFPFLKVIYIWNCPKMKTFMAAHAHEHNLSGDYIQHFFHEKIMFPALQKLYLEKLNDVKGTIFPSSVLRGLKNLEYIEIKACELVEEVFGFDDDDAATVTCGEGTGTFPFLKEIEIWNCPKMKTFMAAHAHEHNLSGDYIQPFFHEKVELPVLNKLHIRGLQDVEELWQDRSQVGSFCQLQTLRVEECSKLLNVIPLRLLITMKNLNEISVENCESIKEVVKIDGLISGDEGAVDDEILTRSHLRCLELRFLPKLIELWWNKDRSGIFSCPDLQQLVVDGCHGLRNIFVPSAIKHDMNIKRLKVEDCSNMEEVVGEDEQGGYSGDKLQFCLVEYLTLENLPNLSSFCKGNYILEWPTLSKMIMNACPNMATFCLGPVSTPQLKGLTQNEDNQEVLREGDSINDIIWHLYIQRETSAKKKHQTTATQEADFGVIEVKDEA